MAIPGYDASTVADYTLESTGAYVDVVADEIPESFDLRRSDSEPPTAALTEPVELVACDELDTVEAIQITLDYEPTALPPGSSPTDVAVAVETEDGWIPLESTVDLAETTVTTVQNERPPGSTVVASYDDWDDANTDSSK